MGNHDTTKVEGERTMKLQFNSGKKLILMNVFHVLNVKKNLIFVNLLCKKVSKAAIEVDKVIISKNGIFVGQGYSCNGMYKLCINKSNIFVYMLELSINLWHAGLFHINF